MRKTVEVGKTPTHEISRSTVGFMGPCVMNTARGPVNVEDAPGALCIQIDREGVPHSVGVLVYDPDADERAGLLVQFDADGARGFAASMLRMADRLSGVKLNG